MSVDGGGWWVWATGERGGHGAEMSTATFGLNMQNHWYSSLYHVIITEDVLYIACYCGKTDVTIESVNNQISEVPEEHLTSTQRRFRWFLRSSNVCLWLVVYVVCCTGGCVLMRMQCPSTSVTTLWVTSVKAPPCWLEPALLKRKTTSDGKLSWGWAHGCTTERDWWDSEVCWV